jgi:hypothetical protein
LGSEVDLRQLAIQELGPDSAAQYGLA